MITVTQVLPAVPLPADHPAWPARAKPLFVDAQKMLAAQTAPSIVISTCRSILEICAVELGATGNNLKAKIDDLANKGIITKAIADWSHALRLEGNAAIHETEGTADQASELVAFVRMLLDMTFTIPATIRERSSAQPA